MNRLATLLETTVSNQSLQACHGKSASIAPAVDGTSVQARNAIMAAMEDLSESDRKELEDEMAERQQRKLECFQKTQNGVVKKADTAETAGAKVNALLSTVDLINMVDLSVASKYGANLTQFTRVVAEDMCTTLEAFRTDLNSSLPRPVRAIVQQISRETQGKRLEESPNTSSSGSTSTPGNHGVLANVSQPSQGVNLNLQQPFYQTMSYGPNIAPMGNGIPYVPIPDVLFPRTPSHGTPNNRADGEMTDGVKEQIARTLREFGFTPRGCAKVYQKPYPEYFDTIPYPQGLRVPDFAKFIGVR
jgi:hypothetical protein